MFSVHSDECKIGVAKLAKMLNVVNHPDHLVTLRAISKLIKTRLNHEALANPDAVIVKVRNFIIYSGTLQFFFIPCAYAKR
jgi:RNA transcription, translation and transport factor protein